MNLCESFVKYGLSVNGVYVEAQGLNNHYSDFGCSYIMLVCGGAPCPQQHAELKTNKVRALCVCCDCFCVFPLLPFLSLSLYLSIFSSSLSLVSVNMLSTYLAFSLA